MHSVQVPNKTPDLYETYLKKTYLNTYLLLLFVISINNFYQNNVCFFI